MDVTSIDYPRIIWPDIGQEHRHLCCQRPAVILVTTESLGLIGEADADAAAKYAKRRDTKRGNEQQEQRGVLEPGIG